MSSVLYRYAADLSPSDGDGRTVFGLAMPYNTRSEVDDGSGSYSEMFAPGAFTRSVRERGSKVKLFGMHATSKFPIGRAESLQEHSDGLHATFRLAETRDGDEALALVRSGTVDGFSVGFRPMRSHRQRDGTVVRTEAALNEVSLVHAPAYEGAVVSGVRSATRTLSVDVARRRLDLIVKSW